MCAAEKTNGIRRRIKKTKRQLGPITHAAVFFAADHIPILKKTQQCKNYGVFSFVLNSYSAAKKTKSAGVRF